MRPLTPATHRGAAAQHSSRARRDAHPLSLADADYATNPYCERCGTDEFIYLETFVPATYRRDGSVSRLGEVTYFCSGCDDYSAHAVPASWAPPGWYFG
ncbi:hypothetical protein QFZ65_000508 [Arthrobacter sp. B3I9]|jgi:hypothetical protein|uniref:hypothetical protein n=1 Tax=Arthrobacter sp. B3I9 TaxID=3042270 RepID=UPI0027934AE0|nr:hypothetical protein [Arthrobacter sp. B3I9]MDQ0848570.1 hypothetical protein [Arthrobacter sp. B3I9]